MDLRAGTTFSESVDQIMHDMDKFTEYMSREPTTKDPPKKTPNPANPGKGPKGAGKTKNKPNDVYTAPIHTATPIPTSTTPVTPGQPAMMLGSTRRPTRTPVGMSGGRTQTNRDSTGSLTRQRYPTNQIHRILLCQHLSFHAKGSTSSYCASLMALEQPLWHYPSWWAHLVSTCLGRSMMLAIRSFENISPTWSPGGTF